MARKNKNMHPGRPTDRTQHYDVDYVFLPDAPDIAAISVPRMKTIYRNMCCAPWADTVHEVKNEDDKYLNMVRRAI